ncbi:MAG: phenylalanine--tRNA ligase subunit beta [bacterium]
MKISYNWLKQYINLNLPPESVAEMLTGCGLEVESMEPWHSVGGGLEDMIFQIGLTPNRSDASSHIGLARDLVAVVNNCGKEHAPTTDRARLHLPDLSGFQLGPQDPPITIRVVDPVACPRYSGLTITGAKVEPSPEWLQNRLIAIGLRPINNIVDISNFVLMETGQPLHAFDADEISGRKVVVKHYPAGTPFVTLDEQPRILTDQDLMICSTTEPMCIAGVFGGVHSGVTESTRNVFLESACFNPVSIRRTARYHGLQTDASFRFERGTDIEMTVFALKRAALLIREIAGGQLTSGIVDVYPNKREKTRMLLSYTLLDRLIGKNIPRDVVKSILSDLEITIEKETQEELALVIPSCKVEVTREADVVEEILRIYGYNNIGIPHEVKSSLSFFPKPDPEKIRNLISDYLSLNGFFEIMCNSLTRSSYYAENLTYPADKCVRILNPLSRDLDVLRQTLLFGGLEAISYNQNRKTTDLKLFETGTVYHHIGNGNPDPDDLLPGYHEEQRLALFLTGRSKPETWNTADDPVNLFELKGYLNAMLIKLSIDGDNIRITPSVSPIFKKGLSYHFREESLVSMGFIRKTVLEKFDIRQPVLYADVNLDLLLDLVHPGEASYRELPKYPEVRRDLALLLDRETEFSEIEKVAHTTEKKLLHAVKLFDVYEGEQVGQGKKSYAVSFLIRDESKTLTDGEIDNVMERLVKAFVQKLGAQIR